MEGAGGCVCVFWVLDVGVGSILMMDALASVGFVVCEADWVLYMLASEYPPHLLGAVSDLALGERGSYNLMWDKVSPEYGRAFCRAVIVCTSSPLMRIILSSDPGGYVSKTRSSAPVS